jgi:mutator protein MutT
MLERDQRAESPSPNPFEQVVEVSAGLVFRHGLLLISQRLPEAHLGGMWEFPGGKRQPDESDENCLKRELMEELGIEVEVQGLLDMAAHESGGRTIRLKFFRCLWLLHEPRPLGCHDFAWIGVSQLTDYVFPPADAQLLEMLSATPSLWR